MLSWETSKNKMNAKSDDTSITDVCFPFLGFSWFPWCVHLSQMFPAILNFSVFWCCTDVYVKPVHYDHAESSFLLICRHLSILLCLFFSDVCIKPTCYHHAKSFFLSVFMHLSILKMVNAKSLSLTFLSALCACVCAT